MVFERHLAEDMSAILSPYPSSDRHNHPPIRAGGRSGVAPGTISIVSHR